MQLNNVWSLGITSVLGLLNNVRSLGLNDFVKCLQICAKHNNV
ncbi:hypothetical protein Zm00014a_037703 [Zea mays]|uniref:Uncharacterized protein n=1 Tax=Zea mays TaxID=4577 RepID=A0A3L6DDM9_MAIZE|nr:hypothetical protein Zm00014a_001580 [Zea mays]PWZ06730.1 hypothetical protein Zm00014a_001580 [Zea mays]PWZ06731.1 hypothetical protein Zm00014a_001580 [Zea mays]PWZ06732.1 hypothetical protein Zm00014a_001580 [Zea mays]PWZ13550.1 hypothetical protein Zm00014a_037703 [Zea mays]